MNRPVWAGLVLVLLAAVAGCEEFVETPTARQPPKKKKAVATKKVTPPKKFVRPPQEDVRAELDIISRAYESSRTSVMNVGRAEDVAVKRITAEIKASLELGPTLVVWVVDRTPSSQKIVTETTAAVKNYYDSTEMRERAKEGANSLLTAVVAYDESTEFLLDPPSSDPQMVQAAWDRIQASQSGREQTFAAIKQSLDKYLSFRTEQRHEMLLVVVTDEAGDDPQLVDELVETTRKNALPVFCLGSPAPWGQVSPYAANPKAIDKANTDDTTPVYGPESIDSERVDIQSSFGGGGGYAAMANIDAIDSGFGPYHLERLCRESRGEFLAIRPENGDSRFDYSQPTSNQSWPPGNETRFDPDVVKRYAPQYISAAEYNRLLSENKAWQALVNAAKLPKVSVFDSPTTSFPKANDAQMARQLTQAQQFPAKHLPPVDRLYAMLSAGEGDRDKLTSPKLQAEFDLAMGQVLALKARLDGYNSMVAALKRGKAFQNASSSLWRLEAADEFETESTIRKMAERAKMYLERVVKEHPGTPWAKIAEGELKNPLGWTWKES